MVTSYSLQTGANAQQRLALLARVHADDTSRLFDRLALPEAAQCLDVGCGTGAVALQLAERIAPNGHVVGLDADAVSIEAARQAAASLGLKAEFFAGSAETLSDQNRYDLVYARCLLSHLRQPQDVLTRMVAAAKSGGRVAVEDIDFSGAFCAPPCSAFDGYVALYEATVRSRGGNPHLGRQLFRMALNAGLDDVHVHVAVPAYSSGPCKNLALLTLDHLLATADQKPDQTQLQLRQDLELYTQDPTTLLSMPRVFQVYGRKR